MHTLKERLQEWTEIEAAMAQLAQVLGIFEPGVYGPKWFYWTSNPTAGLLSGTINALTELGILEYRDGGDSEYRWNPNYVPPS